MAKIILNIEDKNLDRVLTVLKSIKDELITTIEVDKNSLTKKPFKYVPKNGIKKTNSSKIAEIKGAISLKDDFK